MRRFARRILALSALALLGTAVPVARAQQPFGDAAPVAADEATPAKLAQRRAELERGEDAARLAGPVDPKTYRLGPGDRLVLTLRGPVSLDVPLEVEPEGAILVPNDGLVHVAGRTLDEVRDDILQRVRQVYRKVDVQLRLARPRTFRVYLTGEVSAPGPVSANGSFRVADVLALERLAEGASQRNIEVIHADGTSERCDLQLFLQTGVATWNPWLRDGDVVQVPRATRFVHAEGALARPGRYELGQDDSLSTLVRLAGGLLPSARIERILVVRFDEDARPDSLWLPARDVVDGIANLPLADGWRFYVYYTPKYREMYQVTILGEVERPGTYPIVEGRTTLRDLVRTAQGLLPTADSTTIRVRRADNLASGSDPELERLLRLSRSDLTVSEYGILRTRLSAMREDYNVDWTRHVDGGEQDLLLRDGDLVRVGRRVLAIRVGGEVRRPGLQNYVRDRSVDECIELAGGYTNRSWRGKVYVTRAVTGQTLLAANVRSLDPGDLIWVPERPDQTLWENLREVLVALSQVATIVIAIRSVR